MDNQETQKIRAEENARFVRGALRSKYPLYWYTLELAVMARGWAQYLEEPLQYKYLGEFPDVPRFGAGKGDY